jgi:hypothetical protein
LDLGTEFYLLEWMISCFCCVFSDYETSLKILDNFILEGEIYLIRVGLAVLKYKEHELLASNHTFALDQL